MSMRPCKGSLPVNYYDGGPSCDICKEKGSYACETGTIEITPWDLERAKDTHLIRAVMAEDKVKQLEREIIELLKYLNSRK